MIAELKSKLATYSYIDDNTAKIAPDANAALKAAVDKGVVAYGDTGFSLTRDSIRFIIYLYRMGLFK